MSDLILKLEKPDPKMSVIRLKGEFENMSVLNAKEELLRHVREADTKEFVLDFGEITYIDSAGVGVLLEMSQLARERKLRFGLLNVQEAVKKVLTLTHVDKAIKILNG